MEGGALGGVLLISRMVGVAPFLRGAEYRVSLPLVIFAKLFILITAIDFIISAASSNLIEHKYESLIAFDMLLMISRFLAIITITVSVFSSPERTIRMLRVLKQLDQIDKQIFGDVVQYTNEIKLSVLIFIYLHLCVALRVYVLNTGKIHEAILNLLFLITRYMINLSELQVGLFARRTMYSLKVINSSLEKLCKKSAIKDSSSQILQTRLKHSILAWEKVKQRPFNIRPKQGRLVKMRLENIEEPGKLIRQCLINYLCVCDIITASMENDGLLIVIILMLNILNVLTHSYNIILYALASGPNFIKPNIFVSIFWCIVYSVSIIIFLEPYHKTQSEMQMLEFHLMSLKWNNLDEVEMYNELHLFGRVININKPKFSPLGMFTLKRLLVVKNKVANEPMVYLMIFGSLVTYLVIMITYGPKLDNLNQITD